MPDSMKGAVDEVIGLVAVLIAMLLITMFIFSAIISQETTQGTVAKEAHTYNTVSLGYMSFLSSHEQKTNKTYAQLLGDAVYYEEKDLVYGEGKEIDVSEETEILLDRMMGEGKYFFTIETNESSIAIGNSTIQSEFKTAYDSTIPLPAEGKFAEATLVIG